MLYMSIIKYRVISPETILIFLRVAIIPDLKQRSGAKRLFMVRQVVMRIELTGLLQRREVMTI